MKTIIRWFLLVTGSVLIAVSLSVIIIAGIYLTDQYTTPDRTCIRGKMLLHREGNFVDLGDMEFCGTDLSVSGLYGPSLEHHIFLLKRQNADLNQFIANLIKALDECRSKIQL